MPGIHKRGVCSSCDKRFRIPAGDKNPACCGVEVIPGRNWYVWHSHAGKRIERKIGPNLKEAKAALAKMEVNVAEGRANLNVRKVVSWKSAKQKFWEWAERSVSDSTLKLWMRTLTLIEERVKPATVDDITLPGMEEFIKSRVDDGVAASTINDHITCIKRMWTKLEEWGMVENNRIRLLGKETEPDPVERYLTQDEITALLQATAKSKNPHCRLIVLTALHTGLRKIDILTLRRQDIDFREGVIRKEIQKLRKNRKVSIPMTDTLKNELQEHVKKMPASISGYLFPSPRDKTRHMESSTNFGFESAVTRAKIENFRFHDLRHSFATLFLREIGMKMGKDSALLILQKILGHSDPRTTQRYAHVLNEYLCSTMKDFGSSFDTQKK